MAFYVYLLTSVETGGYYVGQTSDLSERLKRHNALLNKYTRKICPCVLLYYISVSTRSEAVRQERYIKNKKKRSSILRYFEQHGVRVPKN